MIRDFNKKKILNICLMLLLVIGISFLTIKVGADSGFDTSYDSGGSSSSSWSSSGSSSFSTDSSSSFGGKTTYLPDWLAILIWAGVFFPLLILGIVMTLKDSTKNKKIQRENKKIREKEMQEMKQMMQEKLKLIDKNLDLNTFNTFIFEKFVSIQEDWMNFNYDGLRSNLSDELYNQYEMQLNTLQIKNEKNIMSDFELIACYIQNVSIKDNIQELEVILEVSFKDYVINSKNKVLRGKKNVLYDMTYKLIFIRNISDKVSKCPKCGAEINKNIKKCPYCKATLSLISNEWVMSEKKLQNQSVRRK